jgi:hypothetical protein
MFSPRKRQAANDERLDQVQIPPDEANLMDAELWATHECFRQLEPLSVDARARVFNYLYCRLGPPLSGRTE